jgi:hypothetical protein
LDKTNCAARETKRVVRPADIKNYQTEAMWRVQIRVVAAYLLLQLKKCESTTAIITFPEFHRLSFPLARSETCNLHGGGLGRRGGYGGRMRDLFNLLQILLEEAAYPRPPFMPLQ